MKYIAYTFSAIAYAICNAVVPNAVPVSWAMNLDCHKGRWF